MASLLAARAAPATTLSDSVRLISATAQAGLAAPVARTFAVTQAGMYTIVLTDLATPRPLSALSVAIATSSASAAQLAVNSPATSATMTVTLAAGTYTVQPVAVPATGSGGSFTVSVTPQGGNSAVFVAPWVVPAAAGGSPPGQAAINTPFTITDAGSYTLTVTDRAFPVALGALQAIVLREPDGMTMCTIASLAAPSCVMTLAAGTTYDLVVLANADATALAGLCSLKVSGGSSGTSEPFATTLPVGSLAQPLALQVAQADTISLQLSDLDYPAPLTSVAAVVVQGAEVLRQFNSPGTSSIAVGAGSLRVYALATPDPARGEGAYALYAHDATSTLADVGVPAVDASHVGYAFTTSLAAAGNYQLTVTDFQLPSPLAALDVLAEQQGQRLAHGVVPAPTLNAGGGTINVLAFANAPAPGSDGLFGIDLVDNGTTATVYQATQGVGAAFQTVDVVASAGKYVANLTDLGFPADFSQVWLVGTGHRQVLTQIVIGQGSRDGHVVFDVPSDGSYVINVLAQTGAGQQYGLYGFNLSTAPSAPTVTLTASATTIDAGSHVTLTWSSTDATLCTASDGWSGALATSGSQDTAALAATTTFTLTCNGDGGAGSASVQVTVRQASGGGGGGGGGALPVPSLWLLALASAAALRRRLAGAA